MLPSVEIIELAAPVCVCQPITPSQIAAGIPAASHLYIDHRVPLEEFAGEVNHVQITASAGLQASRIGHVTQATAQCQQVVFIEFPVFPQHQAAVGMRPARGVSGQTVTYRRERVGEDVALVAAPDGRGILCKRHIAVVATSQRGHGNRPRRRKWRTPESLEGGNGEGAQVAVAGRALRLFEVLYRLLLAPHAQRGQTEIVVSQSSPFRVAREHLEFAFCLRVALQPVIRRAEVIAQNGGVHAGAPRLQERRQRRLIIARAKRLDTLVECLRTRRGGAGGLPWKNAQEQ